jgi:zinc protease
MAKLKKKNLSTNSLPGPANIVRRELSNGIVVLARENFTSPSVVVDGDLRVGALWHGREVAGLSDFTAAMLMRGNERLGFNEIYEQIESLGASLSVSGGTHTSGFYIKCLSEDVNVLTGLAADALRRPTFPAEEVERLRGQIITRLKIGANDTRGRASEAFYEAAYQNHPYSIEEDGYPETIAALTREQMIDFHRQHFGPRGMTVTVVGAVKAEDAVALVEKHFGDWHNAAQTPQPELPALQPLTGFIKRTVGLPGKAQSDILLGAPGPTRANSHFLAARLGNSIIGQFGMGGRIGHQVREKNGMAYYAGMSLNGGLGPGGWYAYAGVNPANVEKAVEMMLAEFKKIISKKVTVQELEDNQAQFLGRLPLSLETNEGVASMISSMELYNLGLDYLHRYPDLIKAITRADIQEAFRAFINPANMVLAVAGPE